MLVCRLWQGRMDQLTFLPIFESVSKLSKAFSNTPIRSLSLTLRKPPNLDHNQLLILYLYLSQALSNLSLQIQFPVYSQPETLMDSIKALMKCIRKLYTAQAWNGPTSAELGLTMAEIGPQCCKLFSKFVWIRPLSGTSQLTSSSN